MARPIQGKEKRIKTTLTFDPAIKKQGEKIAKSRDCSLSKLLEDLIVEEGSKEKAKEKKLKDCLDKIVEHTADHAGKIIDLQKEYEELKVILDKDKNPDDGEHTFNKALEIIYFRMWYHRGRLIGLFHELEFIENSPLVDLYSFTNDQTKQLDLIESTKDSISKIIRSSRVRNDDYITDFI